MIGAILAGLCSPRGIGRRGGLLVAAVLFLVSSIGSAYPEIGLGAIGSLGPEALTPFIFYRIIGGIGIGIASMLSPAVHRRDRAARATRPPRHLSADRHRQRHGARVLRQLGDRRSG